MLAAPPVEGRWINQPSGRYTLGDPRSVLPALRGWFGKNERISAVGKGRINSDVIPPRMCLKGWNVLAFSAGEVAFNLRKAQKAAQKEKNYPLADFYRDLAVSLENSLEPLGIKYEETE